MNKKELAAKLAKKTGLSQAKAAEVISAIFDARSGHGIIAVELDAGKKVTIPGFGTFFTKKSKARVGRSPKTGEVINIKSRTYARFKVGKNLKERVSE